MLIWYTVYINTQKNLSESVLKQYSKNERETSKICVGPSFWMQSSLDKEMYKSFPVMSYCNKIIFVRK